MNKGSSVFYILILLILILPNTFGKFIFDLAGSLFLLSIVLPLIVTVLGWIGWKIFKSNVNNCNICGSMFLSGSGECPICGSKIKEKSINGNQNIPASDVTIDIDAEEGSG